MTDEERQARAAAKAELLVRHGGQWTDDALREWITYLRARAIADLRTKGK